MLRYFPPDRRRRLAPLILVLGLAIVGKLAHDEMPRDQELTFVLPERRVEALRVSYADHDDDVGGFERHFPQGSPPFLTHSPSLSPGRYRVAVELFEADGGITRLDRSIDVPREEGLRLLLSGAH